MIYLLPFVTVFFVYAMQVKGMFLSKPYIWLMGKIENQVATNKNKFLNKLFQLIHKALGGCLVCFCGWIGIVIILIVPNSLNLINSVTMVCYNAIGGAILFRLLTK